MQWRHVLGPSLAGRVVATVSPCMAVAVARHLDLIYVAQLERYNSACLQSWIVRHWGIALDGPGAVIQVTIVGIGILLAWLSLPFSGVVLYSVWLAAGIWLSARYSSLQVSQRLQWTPRTIRLAAVTGILAASALIVTSWLFVAVLSQFLSAPRLLLVGIGLVAGLCAASE